MPLADEALTAIEQRDADTADGVVGPDYDCAADRHLLISEGRRLRALVNRLRTGRPTA